LRDAPSTVENVSPIRKVADWMKTFDTIDEEVSSINSTEASNEQMLNCLYGQKTSADPNWNTNVQPLQSTVVNLETDTGLSSKKPEDLCPLEKRPEELLHLASNKDEPLDYRAKFDNESCTNIKTVGMPLVSVGQNLNSKYHASSGPSNSFLQRQYPSVINENFRLPSITDSVATNEGSYVDHIVAHNDGVVNNFSVPSTTFPISTQSNCIALVEKVPSTFCDDATNTIYDGSYIDHNVVCNEDPNTTVPEFSQLNGLKLNNNSSSLQSSAINTATNMISEGSYVDHNFASNGDMGLSDKIKPGSCSSKVPKLHDSAGGSGMSGPLSERNCKNSNHCNCTADIPTNATSEVGVYMSHSSATEGGVFDNSNSKLEESTQKMTYMPATEHCNTEDTGKYFSYDTTMTNGDNMVMDTTQTSCYLPHSLADMDGSV